LALLAGVLGPRQRQPLAQHIEQRLALPQAVDLARLAVDRAAQPHRASHAHLSVRRASTDSACRRYAALPRTSSIGDAAAATSSPKRTAASSSHADIRDANASASRARSGVGAADPMHVPTRPSSRQSANEQTAITIALRVPTLANCCGPPATGTRT